MYSNNMLVRDFRFRRDAETNGPSARDENAPRNAHGDRRNGHERLRTRSVYNFARQTVIRRTGRTMDATWRPKKGNVRGIRFSRRTPGRAQARRTKQTITQHNVTNNTIFYVSRETENNNTTSCRAEKTRSANARRPFARVDICAARANRVHTPRFVEDAHPHFWR